MRWVGADLDLYRLAARPDHRRVQRLVEIALGPRDVVVELARDRLPQVVHDAQHRVAVADRRHDDPQRADVIELLEFARLYRKPLSFFID